jgi:hypothetical protein
MSRSVLPVEEFQALVQPLIGLPVSRPWKSDGAALYFELGTLTSYETPRGLRAKGEAHIFAGWTWRVEAGAKILCGSSTDRSEIESAIALLRNTTLQAMSASGRVPELTLQFSNGYCLRTMATDAGGPEWSVGLPNGNYLSAEGGNLLLEPKPNGQTSTLRCEK